VVRQRFFIIGAAKAATTSLTSLLDQHPQVAVVSTKEPHFFSYDRNYERGWPAYEALVAANGLTVLIGDASTSYSRIRYFPAAPARIERHVPHAKIIYMVRHPLRRMEAAYVEHMCTPGGQVWSSINEAVVCQPMIVDSSRYWEVFDAYRRHFDEARIHIVWFEEYVVDPVTEYRQVCRFLEIDDTVVPDLSRERRNGRAEAAARLERVGRGHIKINTVWDSAVRRDVLGRLRDDNCRFLEHFDRPRTYWGAGLY
jgi:hypothetical protein